MIEPVFLKVTSYVPALSTVIVAGLKPRSKASTAIVPSTAPPAAAVVVWLAAAEGAAPAAGGARCPGADVPAPPPRPVAVGRAAPEGAAAAAGGADCPGANVQPPLAAWPHAAEPSRDRSRTSDRRSIADV